MRRVRHEPDAPRRVLGQVWVPRVRQPRRVGRGRGCRFCRRADGLTSGGGGLPARVGPRRARRETHRQRRSRRPTRSFEWLARGRVSFRSATWSVSIPALDAYAKLGVAPRFIEVHRLGVFTGRSLDIDVILDLMIHDIDIVLSMDQSRVAQLDAVGVRVLTDQIDIANARLRLESGLIANLTASRVSWEKVRKFRIFAPQTYVSFDFAQRSSELVRVKRRADGTPDISIDRGRRFQGGAAEATAGGVRGQRTKPATGPGQRGRRPPCPRARPADQRRDVEEGRPRAALRGARRSGWPRRHGERTEDFILSPR